jgi:putative hydrolase of the HAD superfamily
MRSLLFDFGGTLDGPLHWLDRFVKHYRICGIDIARSELEPAFDSATQAAYRQSARLQDCDLLVLVKYLVDFQLDFLTKDESSWKISETTQSCADLASRISASFVQESLRDLGRSHHLLLKLARDYTIGIVSNFYGNLRVVLASAGFADEVRIVADSGRLGIYKPDLQIYQQALSMLQSKAHETVMIGDSLTKDCQPARELGMTAIWFRAESSSIATRRTESADFAISSLEELPELLWQLQ